MQNEKPAPLTTAYKLGGRYVTSKELHALSYSEADIGRVFVQNRYYKVIK